VTETELAAAIKRLCEDNGFILSGVGTVWRGEGSTCLWLEPESTAKQERKDAAFEFDWPGAWDAVIARSAAKAEEACD
jgi:hypothetical protein